MPLRMKSSASLSTGRYLLRILILGTLLGIAMFAVYILAPIVRG